MVSMQVRVLLLLSLALVCHWLSGNALAATAPVFFFAITTFLWHFHPSVARSRLGPVAAARFLSVVLTIAAWDAAVAFVVLSAAKAAAQAAGIDAAGAFRPEDAAPYGVLALPAAIALKRPGPELDWLCRLLVGVMYDVPMHLVVIAYWAVGWRLNSLATPVSSGEVLLGALPYESDAAALRGRGVTGVVNLCREWRGPTRRYATLGIEQHHIPTADGDMPSLADAAAAVSFMKRHVAAGGRVFVHCRCGIGRSSTVVLCYLISERGWGVREALDHLRVARPEVGPGIKSYTTVKAFAAAAKAKALAEGRAWAGDAPLPAAEAPVVAGEDLAAAFEEEEEEEEEAAPARSSSAPRRRRAA